MCQPARVGAWRWREHKCDHLWQAYLDLRCMEYRLRVFSPTTDGKGGPDINPKLLLRGFELLRKQSELSLDGRLLGNFAGGSGCDLAGRDCLVLGLVEKVHQQSDCKHRAQATHG